MAALRICSIEGCNKPVTARGWCGAHYVRWMRHGDPLAGRTPWGDPLNWLRAHVSHPDRINCLTWPFATGQNGLAVVRIDGKTARAHRVMCTLVHGDPPSPNHETAHSCGRGHEGCVNPHHLRWDTRKGNFADKLLHGTHNRGDQCPVSKLTEAEVREIKGLLSIMPVRTIARRYGVNPATIYSIRSGASWAWMD